MPPAADGEVGVAGEDDVDLLAAIVATRAGNLRAELLHGNRRNRNFIAESPENS